MRLFPEAAADQWIESGWWMYDDWDTLTRRHAAERPEHLALVDPPNRSTLTDGEPRRLTWRELDAEVDRVAAVLAAHGIGADDIVGIQLPNVAELAAAYLALARLGAIASPFPVQYREHELEALLPLIEAKGFITASRVLGRENAAAIDALAPRIPSLRTLFVWGDAVPAGAVALDATGDAAAPPVARRSAHLNDCITICWTSGTESLPKAIPRAFGDWGTIASGCIDAPQMTPDEVIMNPFPLVNMGAFGGLYCPWIVLGCTLVLHHPFDLGVFLGQIQTERVTYTVAPPAILTRLLQEPAILDSFDLSSIRALGTGSAPVPAGTIRGWEARGVEVINFFGSNEGLNLISDRTSVPDPAQRGELFPSYRADPATLRVRVGAATSIRLVDTATGEEVTTPGQAGELRLKGPTVFSGYYAGTGKPTAFDEQGYYCSGDLFEFADESLELLRYQGRATDLIVRGGFNISPAEIESVLQDHPSVVEVAVVGIPDPELGDRICAFVVAKPGTPPSLADLTGFMADHQVAKFKWPERLELVEALPRNPVGKVLHRDLRAQVAGR